MLLTFLPRPALDADDVVLPDGVLDSIEDHGVGIAEHSERLLAAGQHLKRGLLLHGPPGTGKTHTVRYLMSRLSDCTVVLLTGQAMPTWRGPRPASARRSPESCSAARRARRPGRDPGDRAGRNRARHRAGSR